MAPYNYLLLDDEFQHYMFGPPSKNPIDDLHYAWDNERIRHMFDDTHGTSGGPHSFRVREAPWERTCVPCKYMHGKTLPWVLYEKGLTAPPFHPHCRGVVEVLDRRGHILYVIRATPELTKEQQNAKDIRDAIETYIDIYGEERLTREMLDALQFLLDIAGFVPGFGEIADGLNAVISLFRGNIVDAVISAVSMIPFAGWLSTSAKWLKNIFPFADEIIAYILRHIDEFLPWVSKYGNDFLATASKYSDDIVEGGGKIVREGAEEAAEGAGKYVDDVLEGVGKDITDQLTRAQKRNVNTLDNIINDHLTAGDFSGTLADLQGNPIPNGRGGFFDHINEMKDSYTGLISVSEGLEGSLKNPNLTPEVKSFLQEQLDLAYSKIKEIEALFEPYGGIS